MTRRRRSAPLVLAIAACVLQPVGAPAQVAGDGPYWTSVPTPANFVSLQGTGSIAMMRTTADVRFYSAITRTWAIVPTVAANPVIGLFNDYATVRDGNVITGYSCRTGIFQSIAVSPSAVLMSGPATSSWISIVVDGTSVYGFAAFIGGWSPLTLQSGAPTFVAGSYVALVRDGVSVYALSSFDGIWRSMPDSPGSTISAGGLMGAVTTGTTAVCYSARWGQWITHAFTPPAGPGAPPAPIFRDEFCFFTDATGGVLAFSALTDAFTALPAVSSAALVSHNRCCLALQDGVTSYCYAPGNDAVVTVTSAANPSLFVNAEYALIDDGVAVTAFSGLAGQTAVLPGSFSFFANEDVCLAQSPSASFAYSALTGAWSAAPPVVATQVQTVRNALFLVTPAGYEAFSGRYGTWSSLAVSNPGQFVSVTSGATFCAVDGSTVSVFDSRLGRWTQKTLAAPFVLANVWRMTIIVHDGMNLYGFSELNDVWDQIPFSGTLAQFTANDSIAWARTQTHSYVYASNASLSTTSRYCEFTRMQARGTPLRLVQTGTPGSQVFAALALAPGFLPIGSMGTVVVDPASVLGFFPLGPIPQNGMLDLSVPTPAGPQFNDFQVFIQDVVIPPFAPIYVSNAIAPVFI